MNARTILLAAALTATAVPLTAQQRGQDPQATVALVATLPDSASRAIVLRPAGNGVTDVILLREADATPEDLAAAIAVLAGSRQTDGVALPGTVRLVVQSSSLTRPLPNGVRQSFAQTLDRIRRADVADLSGVGRARSGSIPIGRFRHRS